MFQKFEFLPNFYGTPFFSMGPLSFNGTPFFLQKPSEVYGHGLRIGVGPVPKSFFVSDFANFRTYVLKSLTQPHYAVLSVRNRLG